MHAQRQRLVFLDIMRGVAVLVMVLGHSVDAVLSQEVRASSAFRLYDAVRGFTAPVFLFVAGYAFAVATEKRWAQFHSFGLPLIKRMAKILSLLTIGYALHFPFFSLEKLLHNTSPAEYAQFFQADVLHCLAASMLILHGIVMFSRTPGDFARTVLVAGTSLVMVTPLVWQVNFAPVLSPVAAPYLNGLVPSIFPLFPYAGFMFAGVVVGQRFLKAQREGLERKFFFRLLVIGFVMIEVALIADLLPWHVYPSHDFWKASPLFFMIRFGIITFMVAGFFFLTRIPAVLSRPLITLGQASLLVYAAHLLLVYGSAVNKGLMQVVGQVLPYHQAAGVGVVVLASMVALVHVWNHVCDNYRVPLRFAQAVAASVLLFNFVTRPW